MAQVPPAAGDRAGGDVDRVVPEQLVELRLDLGGVGGRNWAGHGEQHWHTADGVPCCPPCQGRPPRARPASAAAAASSSPPSPSSSSQGRWPRPPTRTTTTPTTAMRPTTDANPGDHELVEVRVGDPDEALPVDVDLNLYGACDDLDPRVPAPVPERPVHRRRCRHRHRPPRPPRPHWRMPTDLAGKPIDPTEWNRNDGFSPSTPILTYVPGLDLHQTWGTRRRPHRRTSPATRQPDAPDRAPRRHDRPAPPVLVRARPAPGHHRRRRGCSCCAPPWTLAEGHRYIVALRDLRDADGRRSSRRPRSSAPTATPPRRRAARPTTRGAPAPPRAPLPRARPGRRRSPRPLPHVGLHRGQRAQPHRAGAAHPRRRRSPRARGHGPGRPRRRGPIAHLRDHQRGGPRRRADDAARRGHDHRPRTT